jgi:hypothetical protein
VETYRARASACTRTLSWLACARPAIPAVSARTSPAHGLARRTCIAILSPWVEDLSANVPPWCPLHTVPHTGTSPESLCEVVAAALEWACRRVAASTTIARAWRQHLSRATARGTHVGHCVLECVAALSSASYPLLASGAARARGLLALCRRGTAVCRAALLHTVLSLGWLLPVDRVGLPDAYVCASRLIDCGEAARLAVLVALRDRIVAAVRRYSTRQAVIAECLAEEVSWAGCCQGGNWVCPRSLPPPPSTLPPTRLPPTRLPPTRLPPTRLLPRPFCSPLLAQVCCACVFASLSPLAHNPFSVCPGVLCPVSCVCVLCVSCACPVCAIRWLGVWWRWTTQVPLPRWHIVSPGWMLSCIVSKPSWVSLPQQRLRRGCSRALLARRARWRPLPPPPPPCTVSVT